MPSLVRPTAPLAKNFSSSPKRADIEDLMRLTAGELTLSAASASCACAAGTSAYNTSPTAASSTSGLRFAGARFDCGGVVVLPFEPPVTSLMNWSAALSAAAAGKYTLIVTHAANARHSRASLSGNTRRIVDSPLIQSASGRVHDRVAAMNAP